MQGVFDFLVLLSENNSKEWMDDNRQQYHQAKEEWIETLKTVYLRLAQYDPHFEHIEAKKTVMRITNNRMFHPDRPVYKTNFAASPFKVEVSAIYIHVSPFGSMIGAGLYKPDSTTLKKIRDAIDYDGDRLQEIIDNKQLQDFFGGLAHDEEMLKTSPRGYSVDHNHIELLRRKSFHVMRELSKKEVIGNNFTDIVEEGYLASQPLNNYLQKAVEF